jgi:hypothetical protein
MHKYATGENINQTEENLYFHVLFFDKDKQFQKAVQLTTVLDIKI